MNENGDCCNSFNIGDMKLGPVPNMSKCSKAHCSVVGCLVVSVVVCLLW